MPGRTVAHHGRISARYVRGFGAAVIAVAALITAANAGPARAEDPAPPAQHAVQGR
ncbi:hypothetical protein RKE30_00520 [Streptomyces sp. Li-HN-5-11]|uniref:hypothetical protein n=1 Tax=Streptomyces sp. Li-HN-5-11 TaxID=3075432 RepID=UPI0028A8D9BA|nr:hypothetical protein [Streptomyces sp. Li-HN-5-11]WNM28994.1 hypothetical protein RKE30_00520 [Streptomyces sp. Li-HN-5-11]